MKRECMKTAWKGSVWRLHEKAVYEDCLKSESMNIFPQGKQSECSMHCTGAMKTVLEKGVWRLHEKGVYEDCMNRQCMKTAWKVSLWTLSPRKAAWIFHALHRAGQESHLIKSNLIKSNVIHMKRGSMQWWVRPAVRPSVAKALMLVFVHSFPQPKPKSSGLWRGIAPTQSTQNEGGGGQEMINVCVFIPTTWT